MAKLKIRLPLTLVAALSLSLTRPALAQQKAAEWLAFSIGPVLAVQDTRKSFFTFISYTPRFALGENFYARPNIGFTMLRNEANELFPVLEAQGILGYFMGKNVAAELGAGMQYFSQNGGGLPALTANLVYRPDSRILLIDRFVFGYTPVFVSGVVLHQARIAAGVTF